MSAAPAAPGRDCDRCPRLVAYRLAERERHPAWHNAPVPSFGDIDAPLLVVGLAPGLKGANRTGRPFTGDYAGELLYATLARHGLAAGAYGGGRDDGPWHDDGFRLIGCRVSNAVRCVPPANKPLPAEITACRGYLAAEIGAMRGLAAILALGRVAHEAVLAALALRRNGFPFGHGRVHVLPDARLLADSYHCSRYNTQTGRLTTAMFEAVVADLKQRLRPPGGLGGA